jgi:hypothetical protein
MSVRVCVFDKMAMPCALVIVESVIDYADLDGFCSNHELDVRSTEVSGNHGFEIFDEPTLEVVVNYLHDRRIMYTLYRLVGAGT